MVRMATLVVGSAALAEEVVQDAFLEVSRRWDSLDRPGAYLRRTVLNGCAMTLRRRSIEDRYVHLDVVAAAQELPLRLIELRDALARLSISADARLVKVSSSIRSADTPRSMRCATREASVLVFPEPAPAMTSSGPST